MLSFIGYLRERGQPLTEAIRAAAPTRLRPVMVTALVSWLGGLPVP